MKVRIENYALRDACLWLGTAVAFPKARYGIALTADEGMLTLQAHDWDVYAEVSLPADVGGPGQVAIPADVLANIAKLADGAVELTAEGQSLHIATRSSEYRLSGIGDILNPPERRDGEALPGLVEALAGMTEFCGLPTQHNDKPVTLGVHLGAHEGILRVEATDSYRMLRRQVKSATELDVILHPATVRAACAHGEDPGLAADERTACWTWPDRWIHAPVIPGRYPDMDVHLSKLGDPQHHITIEVAELASALRMLSPLTSDKEIKGLQRGWLIELVAEGERIDLSSRRDGGTARAWLPAEISGPRLHLGINAPYLMSMVQGCRSERVTLSGSSAHRPFRVAPAVDEGEDEPTTVGIVMPIRLGDGS